MMMARTVAAETLDELAPDDPAAQRSRRDLLRIHQAMGTRSIMAQGWQRLVTPARASQPLRVLELGSGDGKLLLDVARSLTPYWPTVHLTLLDRQDIVSPETLGAYAELGWYAEVQMADVLTWAAQPQHDAQGTALARWDLITTSLFLHHFADAQLQGLLAAVALRTDRFWACEPQRSWWTLAGSHLVGALGANQVTRNDAVLSVHAGLREGEIGRLWPSAGPTWQTNEFDAGWFSHCFSALRLDTA